MGGDLNLKKSWHPSLMSNQKKVWEEEKRALDERKKIEQIRREREEERQIEELQDLQEAAGGKKRSARVDWMYQGPSSGQTGVDEENEAFLLGKRRVDTLLQQSKEKESLQKSAGQDSFMAVQNANTARDTASKIRDDPLLAIKKQEQAAYEAMMSDPIKRRMLLKAAGQGEELDNDRERKRRKHHHHSSRYRDRDSDRQSRNHRSRHDNDHRNERSTRRRRHTRSLSRSRSRSPGPSSERRASPPRGKRSHSRGSRDRSRSPYREHVSEKRVHKARSWHNTRPPPRSHSPPPRQSSPGQEDDKAARLTAMQQDADALEVQRQQRLQRLTVREREAAAKEEKARSRNAKLGTGRADFVNGYHKRAGDLSLSERVGRQHRSGQDED